MPVSPAIVEALKRTDPSVPADEADYAIRPAPEGGPWDKLDELDTLLGAESRFRILLHGSTGVGKTTEMLRWTKLLGDRGRRVMYRHAAAHHESVGSLLAYSRVNGIEVLLLDGLDLDVDGLADNFGPGAPLADPSNPALIAAAPHSLARTSAAVRDPVFTVWHLPPFPVLTRGQRPNAAALDALAHGLQRRLPDPSILERQTLLRRIALASGGVPRDALRILRAALLAAAPAGVVNVAHVMRGERELRQDLEQGLVAGDEVVLARAMGARGTFLGDQRLAVSGAILPYEDADGRYWLPHPLLWTMAAGDQSVIEALARVGT